MLLPKFNEKPPRLPGGGVVDPPPQILAPESGGPDNEGPDRVLPDRGGPLGLVSKMPKEDPIDEGGKVPAKFPRTFDPNNPSLVFTGEAPKGIETLSSIFPAKPTIFDVVLGAGDDIGK